MKSWTNRRRYERRQNKVNSEAQHAARLHATHTTKYAKSRTLIQIDFEPEKVAFKAFTIESANNNHLSGHAGPVEIRPPNRDGQMPCTSFGGGLGLSKDTVTLLLNSRSCFYFLQVDSSVSKPSLCHPTWSATYWSCLLGSLLSCALVLGCLVLGPRLYALFKQWKREREYKQEDKRRSMRMEEKLQSCNSFYSVQTTLENPAEEVFDLRHNARPYIFSGYGLFL
uniref:Uncharacterized protein n=1 Tax=Ditylenchus dipsaci TaxID=166011 RepID=A0A915D7S8_9BILA